MAGDTHATNYQVEVPDEVFLKTSIETGLGSSLGAGGSTYLSGVAGAFPLGIYFDRDTTIDKIVVRVDDPADVGCLVQLFWAASGETYAAANAISERELSDAVDLNLVAAGSVTEMTVNTSNNRIPAGSTLFGMMALGGSLTVLDGVSFTIRGRTRLIG